MLIYEKNKDGKTPRDLSVTLEIIFYLECAEDLYKVLDHSKRFNFFAKKHLPKSNNDTIDTEKVATVINWLHLGTRDFFDTFVAWLKEKDIATFNNIIVKSPWS